MRSELGSHADRPEQPRRAGSGRRCEPSSSSTACSGCGISPATFPRGVGDAGDRVDRAVGVGLVAQQHLARVLHRAHVLGRGEEAAVVVLHRDRDGRRPRRRRAATTTPARRACPRRGSGTAGVELGRSAPGSRWASVSTWKPLQMPSTRPPSAAWRATRRITVESGADRARPQVVAVREAAGHDHRVDALQVGVGVPEHHRLGAHQLDRARGIAVVAGAREGDDADPFAHAAAPRDGSRPRTARSAGWRAPGRRSPRPAGGPRRGRPTSISRSNTLPARTSEAG